jgi:hypothetical protein
MTRFVVGFLALGAMFVALSAVDASAAGYKGIHVGQPITQLPPTLRTDRVRMYFRGQHETDWFVVMTLNAKVLYFDVVYRGDNLPEREVRLAEAIRLHSLQPGLVQPALAYARGRDGRVWGLVDIANSISYETDSATNPDALVNRVTYLSVGAPVVQGGRDHLLSPDQSATLLLVARAESTTSASDRSLPRPSTLRLPGADSSLTASTDDVEQQIRRKCVGEWPTDYVMQEHCLRQQLEAVRKVQEPLDIPGAAASVPQQIRSKCATDWPQDFQMRAHCEKQQAEAYRRLHRP